MRIILMRFFFTDTATTDIYTLSLHDALPICSAAGSRRGPRGTPGGMPPSGFARSEEHTSELQSRLHLVCRLLLEKKKKYEFLQITRMLFLNECEAFNKVISSINILRRKMIPL